MNTMNKDTIIEILAGWNFWTADQETGIERGAYLERLEGFVRTGQVAAITGVRRSGKSTLMRQFIKRQIAAGTDRRSFLYVNFEEPRFAGLLSLEFLQQIYEAYQEILRPAGIPTLLLDEVQHVPRWEQFARALHEKKEARIIISGSTSRLLGKEVGTLLTGRWLELRVYPLDFPEFLRFRGIDIRNTVDLLSQRMAIQQMLREYLEFGGFPLVALQEHKEEILRRYFEDIISRDIAERYRVRRPDRLKALARYYLTSFSAPVSYRKAAHAIGISLDTVGRFSSYMEEAGLIFFIPKFSYSLKEQEANPPMVYAIDPGLVNTVSFRFSDNIGRLYENIVFLSLLRKGKEIYYTKNKAECDFVVKQGREIVQAIQVSYQLAANRERELRGLTEAMEKFGLKEGLVVTEAAEGEERRGDRIIRYVPLWKWLLTA